MSSINNLPPDFPVLVRSGLDEVITQNTPLEVRVFLNILELLSENDQTSLALVNRTINRAVSISRLCQGLKILSDLAIKCLKLSDDIVKSETIAILTYLANDIAKNSRRFCPRMKEIRINGLVREAIARSFDSLKDSISCALLMRRKDRGHFFKNLLWERKPEANLLEEMASEVTTESNVEKRAIMAELCCAVLRHQYAKDPSINLLREGMKFSQYTINLDASTKHPYLNDNAVLWHEHLDFLYGLLSKKELNDPTYVRRQIHSFVDDVIKTIAQMINADERKNMAHHCSHLLLQKYASLNSGDFIILNKALGLLEFIEDHDMHYGKILQFVRSFWTDVSVFKDFLPEDQFFVLKFTWKLAKDDGEFMKSLNLENIQRSLRFLWDSECYTGYEFSLGRLLTITEMFSPDDYSKYEWIPEFVIRQPIAICDEPPKLQG